jgi:hypothetical protein
METRTPLALRPADLPMRVGFSPEALDATIRRYCLIAERNIENLEALGPKLTTILNALAAQASDPATAQVDAGDLTVIYDRLVKSALNLTKATDELARLRSFTSGGPDSRPDLSSMGEVELRQVVITAVKALGITDLRQLVGEK